MMLVDPLKRTNQAAFFFPLGSGATLAFSFNLGAFNAAHRLICALQSGLAPLWLIYGVFGFLNLRGNNRNNLGRPARLAFGDD